VLEVEDVSVRYGEMEAVRGVTFEVRDGEAVGILGANGAGKTTLLKAIMGLVSLASGRIRLDGRSIDRLPAWDRAAAGIAWVPEGRRVFGDLVVEENLRAGGYRNAPGERRQSLERVYALFPRLRERRAQLARTLSGGEQQMLAIGRALMSRPRLLLIDEASLGLAPIFVARVFETIARLRAEGVTLLLVEQNARKSLDVVDRAYLLEVGRFVRHGTARELADDPAVRDAYLGT
jgi:branched-chain amino acid transport system ATP-binding protein